MGFWNENLSFCLNFTTMKIWAIPLLPLAWVYGVIMQMRNFAYDRGWKRAFKVDVPVISIGNITIGGTGKTPMAEFLLANLLEMGLKPAYLSRGYGRKTKGFRRVEPAAGDAIAFGDEALQVAMRYPEVPVAVCEDRVVGARQLLGNHPIDILILDDAFQHRRIHRDLDIVMIDATRPPLKDAVLPAGRLREPRGGLKRADTLVLTKFQDAAAADRLQLELQGRFPTVQVTAFAMTPKTVHPFFANTPAIEGLDSLRGRTVVAFSGLGNNGHFRSTLASLGAEVTAFLAFPDHHVYNAHDMDKILGAVKAQPENKGKFAPALILTTEKDFFRLKEMSWLQNHTDLPLYYLEVGMSPLTGWEIMAQKIKDITRKS